MSGTGTLDQFVVSYCQLKSLCHFRILICGFGRKNGSYSISIFHINLGNKYFFLETNKEFLSEFEKNSSFSLYIQFDIVQTRWWHNDGFWIARLFKLSIFLGQHSHWRGLSIKIWELFLFSTQVNSSMPGDRWWVLSIFCHFCVIV